MSAATQRQAKKIPQVNGADTPRWGTRGLEKASHNKERILTQRNILIKLLTSKAGATSMDIVHVCGTVCPHKRMSELKATGWTILKQEIPGKRYHRYFAKPPVHGGA
jgi:hypothetical protein